MELLINRVLAVGGRRHSLKAKVFGGAHVLPNIDPANGVGSKIVDFVFDFLKLENIPVISHDMWHTGGNYMTDGAHISSSTRLVYNEAWSENGMTEAEVDQLMGDYYGIATYNVLDYIENGGIHHIDTWAKFLDEENVLLKDVWESHWTYDDLNQRETLLESLQSSTGRNYKVHRIYCYNIGGSYPASYTNSLILNDTIYVPTFGNSANGIEGDPTRINVLNANLFSTLSPSRVNELQRAPL